MVCSYSQLSCPTRCSRSGYISSFCAVLTGQSSCCPAPQRTTCSQVPWGCWHCRYWCWGLGFCISSLPGDAGYMQIPDHTWGLELLCLTSQAQCSHCPTQGSSYPALPTGAAAGEERSIERVFMSWVNREQGLCSDVGPGGNLSPPLTWLLLPATFHSRKLGHHDMRAQNWSRG